jgi:putative heme-binding domain-containing protein
VAQDTTDNDSPDEGWLVFHNPAGPGCSRCHTVHGRGGKVGPDLSKIGASFTLEKLVDSILEPSKEVSPQFTNWQMIHTDGRIFTGMIVHENEGRTILGDSEGKTIELKTHEIEERRPVTTSVMPEKLTDRMTVQEWRDLLAYLKSLQ